MNPYEVMFIIDSTAEAEEAVDGYIERFGSLIVQNGGQVTGVDKWGKRRFAYEINGRTEGYYVVLTFKATREVVAELTRVMRLTDHVVRHLVVRRDEAVKAAAKQPVEAPQAESAAAEPAPEAAESAGQVQAEAESAGAEQGEAETTEAAETTT